MGDHFVIPHHPTLDWCFEQLGFARDKPGVRGIISKDGKRVCIALWQHKFVRQEGFSGDPKNPRWSLLYSSPPGSLDFAVVVDYCWAHCGKEFAVVICVPRRVPLPPDPSKDDIEDYQNFNNLVSPLQFENCFPKHHLKMFLVSKEYNGAFEAHGGVNWDIEPEPYAERKRIEGKKLLPAGPPPRKTIYTGYGSPARDVTPKKPKGWKRNATKNRS